MMTRIRAQAHHPELRMLLGRLLRDPGKEAQQTKHLKHDVVFTRGKIFAKAWKGPCGCVSHGICPAGGGGGGGGGFTELAARQLRRAVKRRS